MEKIILGRRKGKTAALISHAAKTGAYIVCRSNQTAKIIQRRAMEMNLDINFPLTYEEFTKGRYHGSGIKGFCIDNIEKFLQEMTAVPITAITLNPPDNEQSGEQAQPPHRPLFNQEDY